MFDSAKFHFIFFRALAFLTIFLCTNCAVTKPKDDFVMIRPHGAKGSNELKIASGKQARSDALPAEEEEMIFKPNTTGNVGLTLGFWGLSLSYSQPFHPEDDQSEEKGKSTGNDLQLHFSRGSFSFDGVSQLYKGYYRESLNVENGEMNSTVFPDLSIGRQAFNFLYNSDEECFDFNARFQQASYSDQSGWSFLLMLAGDSTQVTGIPQSELQRYDSQLSLTSYESLSIGLLGGIGLNLYMPPSVPIVGGVYGAIAALAGPAQQRSSLKSGSGAVSHKEEINLKTNARLVLGIDKGKWFVGSSFWGDSTVLTYESVDLTSSSSQIETFVGARF